MRSTRHIPSRRSPDRDPCGVALGSICRRSAAPHPIGPLLGWGQAARARRCRTAGQPAKRPGRGVRAEPAGRRGGSRRPGDLAAGRAAGAPGAAGGWSGGGPAARRAWAAQRAPGVATTEHSQQYRTERRSCVSRCAAPDPPPTSLLFASRILASMRSICPWNLSRSSSMARRRRTVGSMFLSWVTSGALVRADSPGSQLQEFSNGGRRLLAAYCWHRTAGRMAGRVLLAACCWTPGSWPPYSWPPTAGRILKPAYD